MSPSVPAASQARIEAVQEVLGHRFHDPSLLLRALTHPSVAEEPGVSEDYERLEFLGDAVLTFVVVGEIYARFPDLPEGIMTKMKIALVSGTTLSSVAEELGLASLIHVGQSERGTDHRGLASALENVFEALVAALYLDGGVECAREFVLRTLGGRVSPDAIDALEHPKSILQEMLQARGTIPAYSVRTTHGPPHDRVFEVVVAVDGVEVGEGSGRSKKEAEGAAAANALESLGRS